VTWARNARAKRAADVRRDLLDQLAEFADMLAGMPQTAVYREAQHPRVPRGQPGAGRWSTKTALHYGPGPHPDGTPQSVHGGGDGTGTTARSGPIKTLYHGTRAAPFATFNPGKGKRIMQLGFGIHFTEDPEFARKFYGSAKGGRVIEAQVDLGRTLDANRIVTEDDPEFSLAEGIAKASRKRLPVQHDEKGRRIVYLQHALDLGSPQVAERALRAAGYDSVKYEALVTGGGWAPAGYQIKAGNATSYLVLDPARVRIIQQDTKQERSR
jgi:hypothetical protein